MKVLYKGHAQQFMHAFWGVGQMSFVKHAIFVGEDAPELEDFEALTEHILNRLEKSRILITQGIVDHLDHASPEQFVGGKLGIDATGSEVEEGISSPLDDVELLAKMQALDSDIVGLKQYFTQTKTPVCVVTVQKTKPVLSDIGKMSELKEHIKVLAVVDNAGNDINNPYMLLWRVVNNIDAQRDIVLDPFLVVDATAKGKLDNYEREWPGDTLCSEEVLKGLEEKGLIEIDEAFIKKFGLLDF
jgi:4-hydroxy-3-polyprenylbenzoate decarboxylase